jgi:glutamyl-Q tRNA(Asp) synthetase
VSYVGRFAPSPTGPLHLGSLATAVASFLHARQSSGSWLVRIEDLDPPREVSGAADAILRALEAYDLPWDGPVVHQSRRFALYETAMQRLLSEGRAFHCSCTRSELRADQEGATSRYPGTCRSRAQHDRSTAVRARVEDGTEVAFVDGVQGPVSTSLAATLGDYVIWRRDGLPAYHLAVVVDDSAQGVTAVVRGIDLLDSTAAHLHLQTALGLKRPSHFHVPVVVNADGQKLSKQTGAPPVTARDRERVAVDVLKALGAAVPRELVGARPRELWSWALDHWSVGALRGQRALHIRSDEL